jgi:hypothetical protein
MSIFQCELCDHWTEAEYCQVCDTKNNCGYCDNCRMECEK